MGNRIAEALGGQSITHSYNARNQLIRSDDGEGVTNYNYDRRGNLTEVLRGGILEASYTFGATNMLEKAYSAARGEAEYAYDGLRNRVKRLERLVGGAAACGEAQAGLDPCVEMRYVLDMTKPYDNLLMMEQSGQAERYTWGNELLGAAGEENYFYLQDHLHSPIRLVDGGDGQSDTTLAYDEFGVRKVGPGEIGCKNPFGFTGYQPDDVSGLHYAQARYYDPKNARMVAEDPIRSGLNWYEYCGGNPVGWVDPLGLVCEEEKTITYDRDKAVEYLETFNADWLMGIVNPGHRYFEHRNKMFESITGNNCTNAVSQALWFGGIPMVNAWHYIFDSNNRGNTSSTNSFTFTSDLVKFLLSGGYTSSYYHTIRHIDGVELAARHSSIQKGDVIAFYEGADPNPWVTIPYHVTLVSAVDPINGTISYAGNTSDVVNADLASVFDARPGGSVVIIPLRDEMTVPYNPQYPSPPEDISGFTRREYGSNEIRFN